MLNQIVDISVLMGQPKSEYERNLHLRKENRIQSIHSSLAIESDSLTLEQVTDNLNEKRVLRNPREIKEVKNAYDAYEEILIFNPSSIKDFLKAAWLFNG